MDIGSSKDTDMPNVDSPDSGVVWFIVYTLSLLAKYPDRQPNNDPGQIT